MGYLQSVGTFIYDDFLQKEITMWATLPVHYTQIKHNSRNNKRTKSTKRSKR